MKKSNYSVMTATLLVAIAFTSCSVNDEIQDNTAVRFTATVGEASAAPRAAGTTWTPDDAIGIFMVLSGSTTIAESAENRQYTTTGSGTFTAATGNDIYYPMDGSRVDFIACYPYQPGTSLTTPIAVQIANTQTAANQPTFDLLYSSDAKIYSKASTGTVAMTFAHKLSKIVMNCTAGNGVTALDFTNMTVTIKGMNTANTFNLISGTLGTPSTPAAITPRTITNGQVYDAIIMPGSYAAGALTVEFTLASTGEVFTWNVAASSFDGGNEYIYTVTINRTGVVVTGTINPWTTIDRGNVTAE